eukprot:3537715-Pleurochrysis_carterae.AAC.1
MKLPPCLCAASATRTQFRTIALALVTVAGSPPSLWGTPIGSSRRAADHVKQGGDAITATQSVSAASVATRSVTSSRTMSCPMPPRA